MGEHHRSELVIADKASELHHILSSLHEVMDLSLFCWTVSEEGVNIVTQDGLLKFRIKQEK